MRDPSLNLIFLSKRENVFSIYRCLHNLKRGPPSAPRLIQPPEMARSEQNCRSSSCGTHGIFVTVRFSSSNYIQKILSSLLLSRLKPQTQMIKFGVTQIYKYEIKNLDLDMLLYFAMYNEHPYFGPKLSGKKNLLF